MTESKQRADFHEKTIGVDMQRENVPVVRYSYKSSEAPVCRASHRAITCRVVFCKTLPTTQMTDQPNNETPDQQKPDEERNEDAEEHDR